MIDFWVAFSDVIIVRRLVREAWDTTAGRADLLVDRVLSVEALSNAHYAKNRIETRHDILMPYVLNRCPTAVPKDRDRRPLTMAQKIDIWKRAGRQGEWTEDGQRCMAIFANLRY